MMGASAAAACSGLTIAGRDAYSTTIASHPSLAMYGSSATTTAHLLALEAHLVGGEHGLCVVGERGIQARLRWAIISPVSTSRTPGISHAFEGVDRDDARVGEGAPQDLMCSMPGRWMSST